MGNGRVWGASTRSAPSVTSTVTSKSSAASRTSLQNWRHRIEGSMPLARSTVRPGWEGISTVEITVPQVKGATSQGNRESALAEQLPGSTVGVIEIRS